MNPLVTIAIPIYNADRFLRIAIQSVIDQTFQYWELILINDGSTDRSLEIMREFESDSRVSILDDGENKGLIYRLNESVKLAKGKYYARMDADDIMHPHRIEKQVRYLEENTECDVLGSSAYSIDENNKIIGIKNSTNLRWNRKELFRGSAFIHPSVIGRREWFLSNPYDKEWERAEDYQLWLRTVEHSIFHNLEEPLLYYREVGIPTFGKYLKTQMGFFRFLSVESAITPPISIIFVGCTLSIIRPIVYALFSIVKKEDYLIKRRSTPISLEQKKYAEDILLRIFK